MSTAVVEMARTTRLTTGSAIRLAGIESVDGPANVFDEMKPTKFGYSNSCPRALRLPQCLSFDFQFNGRKMPAFARARIWGPQGIGKNFLEAV
jgi:hypothetical protein